MSFPGRILLTGADGFLGRRVVARLRAAGHEVHAMGLAAPPGIPFYPADLTDSAAVRTILERVRPGRLFHLAGLAVHPEIRAIYEVNTLIAAALLDARAAAGQAEVPLLVMGSAAEYGPVEAAELPVTEDHPARPVTHYGISKLAQTGMMLEAARNGQTVVVARASNLLGPGLPPHLALQSFATQLAAIAAGQAPPVISVGNLESARDFIDGDDAAALVCRLVDTPAAYGRVVHVASGRALKIADGLDMLIGHFGVKVEVRRDPARYKAMDVSVFRADTSRLAELAGPLQLRPFDEILAAMAAHEKSVIEKGPGPLSA